MKKFRIKLITLSLIIGFGILQASAQEVDCFLVDNPISGNVDVYVVARGGSFITGFAYWADMGITLSVPSANADLGAAIGAPDNTGFGANSFALKGWVLAKDPVGSTTPSFTYNGRDYYKYNFGGLTTNFQTNFIAGQDATLPENTPVLMCSIPKNGSNFSEIEILVREVDEPDAFIKSQNASFTISIDNNNADYVGQVYKEDIIHLNNRLNQPTTGTPFTFPYPNVGAWRGGTDATREPDLTDASRNLTIYYGPAVKTMKGAVSNTKFLVETNIEVNPNAGFKTASITNSSSGNDSIIVKADATGYGQYIGPSIPGRIQQYAGTDPGWRNVALPIQPANIATNKLSLGGAPTNSDANYTSYNAAPDACGTFGNAINTVNIIQFEGGASSAEPHEWHSFAPSAAIGGTRGYSMFFGSSFFPTNGTISVKGNFNDPSNVGTFDYVHLSPHATGATGASQQSFTGGASCTGQGANEQAADRKANWDGWALVANPFPCGLSVDQFCTDNGNIPTTNIRIWSKDQGFTITNGQPTTADYQYVAPGAGTNIAPMQAFWVKSAVSGAAVPALVFTDAQRVFSTESFLKTTTEQVELIAMNTADSTANHAILAFDALATKGYDFSFDSYVLSQPGNTRPQLGFHNEYTANGVQVVAPLFVNTVNDMTLNDSYPLRFWSRSAGNYSFYLNQDKLDPNWTVYIEDTKLSPNVYTNITNTSYNFNYVLTDAPTRFILHFGNPVFTIKENTPESWGAQGWFNSSNDLVVKLSGMYLPSSAKVTVFDLAGKELFTSKVGVTTEIIINNNYAPGVYMIMVEGSNGENRFIKVSKGN